MINPIDVEDLYQSLAEWAEIFRSDSRSLPAHCPTIPDSESASHSLFRAHGSADPAMNQGRRRQLFAKFAELF